MSESPKPRQRASVKREEVSETAECVLLEPNDGRVLALNPLGNALWELLDGTRDLPELARILAEATGIEPSQALTDVAALVEELRSEGFLEKQDSLP